MDTTKTQSAKDTSSSTISMTTSQNSPPYWLSPLKEVFVAYAWPITIIILAIVFYKHLTGLLTVFAGFIKRLERIAYKDLAFHVDTGQTQAAPPSIPDNPATPQQMIPIAAISSEMIRRILTTLWHYQKAFNDFSKRWTFTISALHSDYLGFISAMRQLAALGLVAQDPQSQQFFLTDYGLAFCKANEAQLTAERFPFN